MFNIELKKKKKATLQFALQQDAPEGGALKGKTVKVPPGIGKDAYPNIKEPQKVVHTRSEYKPVPRNKTEDVPNNNNPPRRLPPRNVPEPTDDNDSPPPSNPPGRLPPGRLPPRNVPKQQDDDDPPQTNPSGRLPPGRVPPRNDGPGRVPPRREGPGGRIPLMIPMRLPNQ